MKIFSWVHKTFHHNAQKDGFDSSNVRMKWYDNNNQEDSLKEVAVDAGWKDGFLTIGTLGFYGPFKSSNQHKHYLTLESDVEDEAQQYDDDEEEEDEEMKPLISTKFENNYEHVVNEKPNNVAAKVEALLTPTPTLVSDDEIIECIHVGTTDQKEEQKKGERITLADLFSADSENIIMSYEAAAAKKVMLDEDETSGNKEIILKTKQGHPTFTKKLISRVSKNNPHPIKSIRKLVKKMTKKKIHPAEVDVQNQKSEEQQPSASEICENQKIEGTSG